MRYGERAVVVGLGRGTYEIDRVNVYLTAAGNRLICSLIVWPLDLSCTVCGLLGGVWFP